MVTTKASWVLRLGNMPAAVSRGPEMPREDGIFRDDLRFFFWPMDEICETNWETNHFWRNVFLRCLILRQQKPSVGLIHSQTKVLDLGIWWIPTCYLMNFTIQIANNTFDTWKLENLNNKKHTWNFEPKHRLVRPGSSGGNVWRWDPGADGKTWYDLMGSDFMDLIRWY